MNLQLDLTTFNEWPVWDRNRTIATSQCLSHLQGILKQTVRISLIHCHYQLLARSLPRHRRYTATLFGTWCLYFKYFILTVVWTLCQQIWSNLQHKDVTTRLCQSNKYVIRWELVCCTNTTKQIFLEQISDRILQPILEIAVSIYPTARCTTKCKMIVLAVKAVFQLSECWNYGTVQLQYIRQELVAGFFFFYILTF